MPCRGAAVSDLMRYISGNGRSSVPLGSTVSNEPCYSSAVDQRMNFDVDSARTRA